MSALQPHPKHRTLTLGLPRPHKSRDLTMAPFFGNSVACRLARAHEVNHSTLVLGDWRAAQRIEFSLGGGRGGGGGGNGYARGWGPSGGNGSSSGDGNSNSSGSGGSGNGARGPLGSALASMSAAVAAAAGGGAGGPMKFWVVNTHLDHDHTDNRQRQVRMWAHSSQFIFV